MASIILFGIRTRIQVFYSEGIPWRLTDPRTGNRPNTFFFITISKSFRRIKNPLRLEQDSGYCAGCTITEPVMSFFALYLRLVTHHANMGTAVAAHTSVPGIHEVSS